MRRSLGIAGFVFAFLSLGGAVSANYADWRHSGSMYILTTPDGANLPESAREENFPLLVRLNKDWFDFSQAKPQGEDIRFSADGTPLAFQMEEWDPAQGVASFWVKVPVIRGNARQELKVHWGEPKAASESNASAVFNAENGYVSVIHMGESLSDELGAVTPNNLGSTIGKGMIGVARHIEAGQGINCGDHLSNLPFGDNALTSEAWFRAEATDAYVVYYGRYATRLNGKSGDGNEVAIHVGSPPRISWASDGPGGAVAKVTPEMRKWNHVAATYENGESRIYVNGKLEGNRHHPSAMSVVKDVCMNIGGMRGTGYRFVGEIDEVRISRVARSPDWLKLQFENQNPMQSMVGPIVQEGAEFAVSHAAIDVPEGKSVTISAKAGGAQKLAWILKRNGVESVVAVDRLSFTLPGERVTQDTSLAIQFKAIYADGAKTKEIPVSMREDIPEPIVVLSAPTAWNGRDRIEVVPQIKNLEALQARNVDDLKTTWSVSGGAVIKEISPHKLTLLRSQTSGAITVKAMVNNGGASAIATAAIVVTEPQTDPWVQRIAGKLEQPEENQFYARDDKNEGTLIYNGILDRTAEFVFLRVFANEEEYQTERQKPGADGSYAFTIKLKPGLNKYKLEFGATTGRVDSVLNTVGNIVCGDAYIIQGQSNAEATGPNNGPEIDQETPLSTWIRSYGNSHNGSTKGGWGNAIRSRIWGRPDYGVCQIGTWGMTLGAHLVEKYQMPICIMNGAVGGTRIDQHQRNEADHRDPHTIYGRLLCRIEGAKLTHGIRGVLWHQGENNQGSASPTGDYDWKSYQQYFVDLSAAWKQDYPNIQHYYVYQIWPSGCNMGGTPEGDMLLEMQRTLPSLYSNMRIMSTLGIVSGSSGRGLCHFDREGYEQIARLMSPLLEQDNYGLDRTTVRTAPNLKMAHFRGAERSEIVLEFDQPMKWKEACKAWFNLDGVAAPISEGTASGNTIVLRFAQPVEAKSIAYLSGRNWDGKPDKLVYGTNGIAALAFSGVAIEGSARASAK